MARFLVIVADDLSQRDLAAYRDTFPNETPPPTPHIDRLVERGVRFTRMVANPICSPTRATLLTGKYGFRTGVGSTIGQIGHFGLSTAEVTLPKFLGEHGYASACIGKWHLSYESESIETMEDPSTQATRAINRAPQDHGFDHYRAGALFGGLYMSDPPYHNWRCVDDGILRIEPEYATRVQGDAARDWVFERKERPDWLAFLTFNAPHKPFHVPPRDLLPDGYPEPATDRDRFEAMLVAMDAKIGDVLDHVDLETTTVFFLSDNGTPTEVKHARSGPTKGTLFRESLEIPFLVAGAGVQRPGSRCDALANTTDLFATIAELAGLELPEPVAVDSVSFAPQLADPARPGAREWAFAERFSPNGFGPYRGARRALQDSRYKLLDENGTDSLFDLEADPTESSDLRARELTETEQAAYRSLRGRLTELLESSRSR